MTASFKSLVKNHGLPNHVSFNLEKVRGSDQFYFRVIHIGIVIKHTILIQNPTKSSSLWAFNNTDAHNVGILFRYARPPNPKSTSLLPQPDRMINLQAVGAANLPSSTQAGYSTSSVPLLWPNMCSSLSLYNVTHVGHVNTSWSQYLEWEVGSAWPKACSVSVVWLGLVAMLPFWSDASTVVPSKVGKSLGLHHCWPRGSSVRSFDHPSRLVGGVSR